jgi:hypothetical protein
MMMTVFLYVAPFRVVEDCRRFRSSCFIHIRTMMEPEDSVTLVNFYQTTRSNITEDSHFKNILFGVYLSLKLYEIFFKYHGKRSICHTVPQLGTS